MRLEISLELRRSIPVTLVKEYCWCPAIPWIAVNYGVEPPLTPSMEEGIAYRSRVRLDEIAEELRLPEPRMYEVFVSSKKLGVHGYIDIVAGRGRYTVVEVKAFESRRWKHFRSQLILYALLVNAELGPVRRSILVLGRRVIDVAVTDSDILYAKKLVEEVWRTILSPEPPRIQIVEQKCRYCRYRRLCPLADGAV